MAKSWALFRGLIILVMMGLGVLWFVSSMRNEEPTRLYPATIDRDCAPWDGTAFSVSIPWNQAATFSVSIYQSPEITELVTFSFPDETMKIGNAYLLRPDGSPEPLNGKVFFERVHAGKDVEGGFDLISAGGEKFLGTFRAEWGVKWRIVDKVPNDGGVSIQKQFIQPCGWMNY